MTSTSASGPTLPSSKDTTKIGVGVSIPLGVLMVIASFIALFFWHRGRKQVPGNQISTFGKAELPAQVLSENEMAPKPQMTAIIHNLYSNSMQMAEMHGISRTVAMRELPS
jgi:hypothetical protein